MIYNSGYLLKHRPRPPHFERHNPEDSERLNEKGSSAASCQTEAESIYLQYVVSVVLFLIHLCSLTHMVKSLASQTQAKREAIYVAVIPSRWPTKRDTKERQKSGWDTNIVQKRRQFGLSDRHLPLVMGEVKPDTTVDCSYSTRNRSTK